MAQFSVDIDINPYRITCGECGDLVSVDDWEVDSDGDVIATLHPCQNCIQVAVDEATGGGEDGEDNEEVLIVI